MLTCEHANANANLPLFEHRRRTTYHMVRQLRIQSADVTYHPQLYGAKFFHRFFQRFALLLVKLPRWGGYVHPTCVPLPPNQRPPAAVGGANKRKHTTDRFARYLSGAQVLV
jgi:hypothetical protein